MSATPPAPTPHPSAASTLGDHDALPAGTRLDEFEILRVLGVGGFGIVYLAMDHALERQVAIKEYMPGLLAARGEGLQVSIRSAAHAETFEMGLRYFVNEAKLLARFDHPSLVKVYRFWEGNGTAYMEMPFYAGRTLKDERRARGSTVPDEAWMRSMIDPLLGALEALHREDVYHRDIAPDNILLLPSGLPVLLDFGAARHVIGDQAQTLTAILKPSYAPIEQYANVNHLRQGPWTDLYALGAVLHYMITGRPPTPSAARAVHDEVPLLMTLDAAHRSDLSDALLAAIDWALEVRPGDRPQSVAELRDVIDGIVLPPARTPPEPERGVPVSREEVRAAWARTEPVPASKLTQYDPTMAVTQPAPPPLPKPAPAPVAPTPLDHQGARFEEPSRRHAKPARSKRRRQHERGEASDSKSWGIGFALAGLLGIAAVAAGAWQLGVQHSASTLGQGLVKVLTPHAVASRPPPVVSAASISADPAALPVADGASAATVVSSASVMASGPLPAMMPHHVFPSRESAASAVSASRPRTASARPDEDDRPQDDKPQDKKPPDRSQETLLAAAPASLRDACSGLKLIGLTSCLRRECKSAKFHDHASCVKVRELDDARKRNRSG